MPEESIVIAIDGPAAAGKGTLARRIADRLGFAYLDTGLLYRAVGAKVLQSHGSSFPLHEAISAAQSIEPSDLHRSDLRTDVIALAASRAAEIPAVRSALLQFQRSFALQPPGNAAGAVIDGRDIGSVVCPNATIKLFVTASEAARANRRLQELRSKGLEAIHAVVLRDLRERDGRDASRSVAPLKPPEDAFVIDTTHLDPDGVFELALELIRARYPASERTLANQRALACAPRTEVVGDEFRPTRTDT